MYELSKLLTTGQAARLCAVTPDTVLKWIKRGRIAARRTAGGHYRIERRALRGLETKPPVIPGPAARRSFQYCWEYNAHHGRLRDECQQCVAYRTRAYRCYEVLRLAPEAAHGRLFCDKTCDSCDYYVQVHKQDTNVLVVSDNQVLTQSLRQQPAPFNLKITDCEYACSALVETFRPDFAIIDCSLGEERTRDMALHLKADPRIPYVHVILAARAGEFPKECDREVFAHIESPFHIEDLVECIQPRWGARRACQAGDRNPH